MSKDDIKNIVYRMWWKIRNEVTSKSLDQMCAEEPNLSHEEKIKQLLLPKELRNKPHSINEIEFKDEELNCIIDKIIRDYPIPTNHDIEKLKKTYEKIAIKYFDDYIKIKYKL